MKVYLKLLPREVRGLALKRHQYQNQERNQKLLKKKLKILKKRSKSQQVTQLLRLLRSMPGEVEKQTSWQVPWEA